MIRIKNIRELADVKNNIKNYKSELAETRTEIKKLTRKIKELKIKMKIWKEIKNYQNEKNP